VESIRRAAERTAAVTAQLLAFSRRQVLNPQVLELNALLRRFQPVLERIMGEDCTVALRLAPSLDPVKADPGQLEQVLVNLALNARDAMPRGGTLAVETFAATPTRARWPPGGGDPGATRCSPSRHRHGWITDPGPRLRAVLHHQGVGRGTGLGLSTVWNCQTIGRIIGRTAAGLGTTWSISR
jgi:two-component system cell cycle sensor histidine kinase/response regulator CckA